MNVSDNQFETGFDCGWYGMTAEAQMAVTENPGEYHGPPMSDRLDPDGTGLWKIDTSTAGWPAERRGAAVHPAIWQPDERIKYEDLGSGAPNAWQKQRAQEGQDFGGPALVGAALLTFKAKVDASKERGRQESLRRAERTAGRLAHVASYLAWRSMVNDVDITEISPLWLPHAVEVEDRVLVAA